MTTAAIFVRFRPSCGPTYLLTYCLTLTCAQDQSSEVDPRDAPGGRSELPSSCACVCGRRQRCWWSVRTATCCGRLTFATSSPVSRGLSPVSPARPLTCVTWPPRHDVDCQLRFGSWTLSADLLRLQTADRPAPQPPGPPSPASNMAAADFYVRSADWELTSTTVAAHEVEYRRGRDGARNNARCTQARKTTHGLGVQHQDVERTPR